MATLSLMPHKRRVKAREVEAAQPFSWTRCVVSLVSYALLLSDVVRSGFGIRGSNLDEFARVEPDAILHFGPFAYPLVHLSQANLSSATTTGARTWSYKFDTTSVSMRSIARQLNPPKWPPCIFYHGECKTDSHLPFQVVFDMIDSLVDVVAAHRPSRFAARGHLTVRAEYDWFDRLHHFALPWFFKRTVKRTAQAIHYSVDNATSLSAMCSGSSHPRPYACDAFWTQYRRLCDASTNAYCAEVTDTVWSHIDKRMAKLRASYANDSVDFVVIEGADDYTRPGIAFQGRRLFDVATFARVRDCSSGATVAVDDYRYEAASMTINAPNWFGIVALIRGVGQVYAWVRLVFLLVGTYAALRQGGDRAMSPWGLVVATLRTALIIPSQVVIYGSVLPIVCYVAAHLLDSAAVYELVALHFNSPLGQFHLDWDMFFRICAVSMRSLWALALSCRLVLALYTKRSWSSVDGLPGILEFSISFVASFTILAQIRSTAWRSTKILHVYETVPSARRHCWLTMSFATPRNPLNKLFFASTIDAQCLMSSLLLFLGLMLVSRVVSWLLPRLVVYRISLFSRSLVPYLAGLLWLTNGLVVCWHGAFLVRIPSTAERPPSWPTTLSLIRGLPFRKLSKIRQFPWHVKSDSTVVLAIADTEISMQLQRDMQSIDMRSREVEAMVFLVNLAAMTDPVTFVRLCVFGGRLVSLYRSKQTERMCLLPHLVATAAGNAPIDFDDLELVTVVNSRQLPWCELLQCG